MGLPNLRSLVAGALVVTSSLVDASPATVHSRPPVAEGVRPENSTHTFKPSAAPKVDRKDPKNLVPAKNVTLSYGPEEDEEQGSIDMSLIFKEPAVALEHVESVADVACGDNTLTVSFENEEGFDEAVQDWDIDSPFVLITGAVDDGCASEFERGFFIVDKVTPDADNLAIEVHATKGDLPDLAGEMEMSFNSLPAATLTRRLDLNPEYAIEFEEGLEESTTIFSGDNGEITAEEAWFSSNVTFSGRLKYNFWLVRVEELYFDLDADFEASAAVSANITKAFSTDMIFQPDELAFSLVDVPGIIALGPGVAFGLSVALETSSATELQAGADISLPAGKVHIDFLDGDNTETSGWEPVYDSYANITRTSEVQLDIGPAVTVALQFKLLGGLLDLSSGIRAVPGFGNNFKFTTNHPNMTEEIDLNAGSEEPENAVECTEGNAFQYASTFFFRVTAFATQWWDRDLYEVEVPIAEYCVPL